MSKNTGRSCPKCHEPIASNVVRCPCCGANIGGADGWVSAVTTVVLTLFGALLLLVGGCTALIGGGFLGGVVGRPEYGLLALGVAVALAGLFVIRVALGRHGKR